MVASRLARIEVSEADSACVAATLSTQDYEDLQDKLAEPEGVVSEQLSSHLAESLIECVGKQQLARSALVVLSGSASEESLDCIGERFDEELLADVIDAGLRGQKRISVEVEVEIGLVLGACLTPEELLQLHLLESVGSG